MRDVMEIIANLVNLAYSLEEARKLVQEEIAKGDCTPIMPDMREKWIACLWRARTEREALIKYRHERGGS